MYAPSLYMYTLESILSCNNFSLGDPNKKSCKMGNRKIFVKLSFKGKEDCKKPYTGVEWINYSKCSYKIPLYPATDQNCYLSDVGRGEELIILKLE